MSSSDAQHDARELLADVLALRQRIAKQGRQTFEKWSTHIERPSFRVGALNFAHYLAFRSQDLRSLQRRLMPLGLSSLGRAEGRVIASLDAVIHALSGITGAPVPNGMPLLRHRDRWARGLLNKQVGFELGISEITVKDRHLGTRPEKETVADDSQGVRLAPNVELAKGAGLAVGDGIILDEMLCTNDPNIFAAGDVANFPCAALKQRLRFEHEDNARAMGRTAGRNMAGGAEPYRHLPFFYSDLFDLGYEAVGEIDSGMAIIEDWVEKFHKGVIYYLKHSCVRGVLLWNTWGLVDAARNLIASGQEQTASSLIGRLR